MKTTYRSILMGLLAVLTLSLANVTGVQAQTTGREESHYSNLVIFAQFADSDGTFMSNEEDAATIQKYYNDGAYQKSLVSFVRSISYGQLTIDSYLPQVQNGVIAPIQLSRSKADYGDSAYTVQKEVIDAFNTTYGEQLAQYDLDENSDGVVDNVTFIFEGADDNRTSAFFLFIA